MNAIRTGQKAFNKGGVHYREVHSQQDPTFRTFQKCSFSEVAHNIEVFTNEGFIVSSSPFCRRRRELVSSHEHRADIPLPPSSRSPSRLEPNRCRQAGFEFGPARLSRRITFSRRSSRSKQACTETGYLGIDPSLSVILGLGHSRSRSDLITYNCSG